MLYYNLHLIDTKHMSDIEWTLGVHSLVKLSEKYIHWAQHRFSCEKIKTNFQRETMSNHRHMQFYDHFHLF